MYWFSSKQFYIWSDEFEFVMCLDHHRSSMCGFKAASSVIMTVTVSPMFVAQNIFIVWVLNVKMFLIPIIHFSQYPFWTRAPMTQLLFLFPALFILLLFIIAVWEQEFSVLYGWLTAFYDSLLATGSHQIKHWSRTRKFFSMSVVALCFYMPF